MRTDPTFWIIARGTGLTAYALVTCSVLAGLLLKSRPLGTALKPSSVTDVHRFIALLALCTTALHGIALTLDTKVDIPLHALVVPGLVPYRPVWTSLGVLGAELMVIVYLSFPLRKRIGTRRWRQLHWATYAIFATVTVHGVVSGSDSDRPWVLGVYLTAIGSVVFATTWRVLVPPMSSRRLERKTALPTVAEL